MKTIKRPSKGLTIIEILLVVTVVAFSSVIAFKIYEKVDTNQLAQREAEDLRYVQDSIRNMFPSGTYNDLPNNTGTIRNLRLFPMHKYTGVSAGAPRSVWGGAISLSTIDINGSITATGKRKYFLITYREVPSRACAEFISRANASFGRVMVYPGGSSGSFNIDGEVYRSLVKNDFVAPTGAPSGYSGRKELTEKDIIMLCSYRETADIAFMSN